MYEGVFEIQSYEVGIWDEQGSAPGGGWYFAFGSKRYLTAMGRDATTGEKFSVWFLFGASSTDSYGNPCMGAMFFPKAYDPAKSPSRASFWVTPPEDYYADLYAILRSEKPVHFHYRSEEGLPPLPTPPATNESDYSTINDATGVYYFCVKTGIEPVGEGVDWNASKTKIRKRIQLVERKAVTSRKKVSPVKKNVLVKKTAPVKKVEAVKKPVSARPVKTAAKKVLLRSKRKTS